MATLFKNAKALAPATSAAGRKKEKREVAIAGIQTLAELKAMAASIEAAIATVEAEVKDAGFSEFVTLSAADSFRGTDGFGSASVEMRKRGTNSALNEEEVSTLKDLGIIAEKCVIVPEMFAINPAYAGNEALLEKVSKAIAKIVPEDFIVMQEEKSKMVVNEAMMAKAFTLPLEKKEVALRIVTTMALKPKLEDGYDMETLAANVNAILNGTDSQEISKAA